MEVIFVIAIVLHRGKYKETGIPWLYLSVNTCVKTYIHRQQSLFLQSLPNTNINIDIFKSKSTRGHNSKYVFVQVSLHRIRNIKMDGHPEAFQSSPHSGAGYLTHP